MTLFADRVLGHSMDSVTVLFRISSGMSLENSLKILSSL
jgi:hypothetical protein